MNRCPLKSGRAPQGSPGVSHEEITGDPSTMVSPEVSLAVSRPCPGLDLDRALLPLALGVEKEFDPP